MSCDATDDRNFLAWLTLLLIVASLWIFYSYLHYLLVGGVLAVRAISAWNSGQDWSLFRLG